MLSKNPDYRAYGKKVVAGDLPGAIAALDRCIGSLGAHADPEERGFLWLRKSKVFARLGENKAAREAATTGVCEGHNSPRVELYAAELFVTELHDPQVAVELTESLSTRLIDLDEDPAELASHLVSLHLIRALAATRIGCMRTVELELDALVKVRAPQPHPVLVDLIREIKGGTGRDMLIEYGRSVISRIRSRPDSQFEDYALQLEGAIG